MTEQPASLAVAMTLAILLVCGTVFGAATAAVSGGAIAIVFGLLWAVLAPRRRRRLT